MPPAYPLQEQLQALQRKVRAVVPQVQRLTPIYDSSPLPPEASGCGGSSVVLPVSEDGRLDFVVGFLPPRWPTISLPCEISKPAIT